MKKIKFVVFLMSVLMAVTLLFSSCDKTTPSTENNGTSPGGTTQCEHNYTNNVTAEATCGQDGVKTFICSVCNDSYTESIAATGNHNYASKVTTEATCTQDGVKIFTCSMCKDSYTESIAATGNHNYASKITTEATCTQDGVKIFTCSMCKDSYTESIAARHKWTNATCTAPKICSACKLTEGSALGHEMKDGECTRCDFSNKWSYAHAKKLETYATNCFKHADVAFDYAWDAYFPFESNRVSKYNLAIARVKAIQEELGYAKELADSRAEIRLETTSDEYSTLQGKITHLYKLCSEITNLVITSANCDTVGKKVFNNTVDLYYGCQSLKDLSTDLVNQFY